MENFDHYKPVIQIVDVEYPKNCVSDEMHWRVSDTLTEFRLLLTNEEIRRYPTWKLTIKLLTDEMRKNPWIANTKYSGVTDRFTGTTVWVTPDITAIQLLWILFHEYRHWIQYHNPVLLSCVDNKNVEMWMSSFKDRNIAEHVLHEIHPAEVDANIYACDKLTLAYPGSKFDITPERLKMLELKSD